MPTLRRQTSSIPNISSRELWLDLNDYSAGMNDYVSNDKFPVKNDGANMWRLAQDARIITLGEYETRKGFDFHSSAVASTMDDSETSSTGAADQSFNGVTRLAQPFVPVQSGRLNRLDIRLKNDATATGTVLVELWTNVSNAPGVKVARTSIGSSSITSSYAYLEARFPDAPVLAGGVDYWIVVYVQATASGSYKWSSTTANGGAMTSTNSGSTWSAISGVSLNFKQYYTTNSATKGLFRAYKSDGTKVTLFAHGTVLYSVNNVTGALTSVKTGLNANATKYRFVLINDIVYYCNGYDGLRKWDFTTESQVNSTNYSILAHHIGLLWGVRVDEPTRVDYSNFGDYETFTSTDFLYAIGPKTGDPITGVKSLNGYLILKCLDNTCIVSGDDNATFTVEEAPDQNGTYSQETLTSDANFIYYLSDDGVYRSNGSEAQLLSENIYETIRTLQNKDDCCMVVNKGRLYLWYRSAGSSHNDCCYVWNLNYSSGGRDTIESHDTQAYVSFAFDAFQDDDDLLVASSLIGQVYWQEQASNDYTNLGGDINFALQHHYHTFSTPAALHQVRQLLARFGSQSDDYTVTIQYAYDLRDNWQTLESPGVQGSGTTWGSGALWGAFTWGRTAEVSYSGYIPGEYKRIAVRYQHYATRQPQKFLGNTMRVQTRRIR